MKKKLLICFSLLACLAIGQAKNVKDNVLPLALQSFSVNGNTEKATITWKTTAGKEAVCYTIEKSKDGKNFTKIIEVQNTATVVNYRDYVEVDYKPYKGVSYYRLKQIDKNGNYKYSVAVLVTGSMLAQKSIKTYANLVNSDTNVGTSIKGHDSQKVVVVLRDLQGGEFVSKLLLLMEKNVVFLVDEEKLVPPGNYIITSSSDDKIYNYQLTVK